jgi:tRNA G10  N-methylase Trm11
MDYLIRFSQTHETFRLPEIQALALIEGVDLKVVSYSLEVSCHGSSSPLSLPLPLHPL